MLRCHVMFNLSRIIVRLVCVLSPSGEVSGGHLANALIYARYYVLFVLIFSIFSICLNLNWHAAERIVTKDKRTVDSIKIHCLP